MVEVWWECGGFGEEGRECGEEMVDVVWEGRGSVLVCLLGCFK